MTRPLIHTHATTAAYIAKADAEFAAKLKTKADRYIADPKGYMERRAAIGWAGDVPLGVEPAEVAEPEPHTLPGYRLHLAMDAITEAFLEKRYERARRRSNTDERDDFKAMHREQFANVGIGLYKLPGWDRATSYISDPRLK